MRQSHHSGLLELLQRVCRLVIRLTLSLQSCRYQSTILGSFQTLELIDTFLNYAESIKRCVCIVYDSQKSATGTLALKAIRLKDAFMKVICCLALTLVLFDFTNSEVQCI